MTSIPTTTEVDAPIDILKDVEFLDLVRMERLLQLREVRMMFALDHHVNTHGERMDFTHYPHIRQLYESIAPEIVLQGSVQSFKSEWAVIDHFAASYVGLAVFFVVPKFEARTTYVQNRVNRCVENVPEYKKIIGDGFFDSVALKSFGKGTIKYVGSNVFADFREYPADMIVVEEVDECHQENVEYANDRLRASKFQFKRYLGNPKRPGGGINKYFLRSDQREWEVPCHDCGEYSQMEWFQSVVQAQFDREGNITTYELRDKEWKEGCGRDIRVVCPKCGGTLERSSLKGRWVAMNPTSTIEGYHISMLCSPINSIASMWGRFKAAIHTPIMMQQFYNSDLGLPFDAMGSKVTETLLDSCVEKGYNFVIKPNCAHIAGDSHPGPCSMGVDVGGHFDVRISFVEPRGVRRCVYIGKLPAHLAELNELIERYHVEKCVIDSMPEATLVQDFQDSAPCDVWSCRYQSEGKDFRRTYDPHERVVKADRTETLDRSYAQLRQKRNILPENVHSMLGGEYSSEMTAPVRSVVTDDSGKQKFEWSKCKDHQRHCDGYDMIASQLMLESVLDEVVVA